MKFKCVLKYLMSSFFFIIVRYAAKIEYDIHNIHILGAGRWQDSVADWDVGTFCHGRKGPLANTNIIQRAFRSPKISLQELLGLTTDQKISLIFVRN